MKKQEINILQNESFAQHRQQSLIAQAQPLRLIGT